VSLAGCPTQFVGDPEPQPAANDRRTRSVYRKKKIKGAHRVQ